jgi:hypothetical protein
MAKMAKMKRSPTKLNLSYVLAHASTTMKIIELLYSEPYSLRYGYRFTASFRFRDEPRAEPMTISRRIWLRLY